MDNIFLNLNDETKIKLALSYENADIIEKFCREYDVEPELAKEYFIEVKKFLYLCSNTKEKLAPSAEIDKIWHTFMLFTKDYEQYCMHFLGKFIDHIQVKNDTSPPKENYLLNTITNYESVFGELNNKIWQVPYKDEVEEDDCYNCSSCSNYNSNCQHCSSCEANEQSCVFTGNCFDCTDSGRSYCR